MVPYVRKSFFKHFKNALDYLYNSNSEWLIAAIENDKIENISIDDKLYDYNKDAQHYALQMTLKEINQSVEGLYHNLNY
jgi:ribonucleoside-triphosphate reductase